VAKDLEEDQGLKFHVVDDIEDSFLSGDASEARKQSQAKRGASDGKKTNSH